MSNKTNHAKNGLEKVAKWESIRVKGALPLVVLVLVKKETFQRKQQKTIQGEFEGKQTRTTTNERLPLHNSTRDVEKPCPARRQFHLKQ